MMGELRAPGFKTSVLEDYLPNKQIAYPLETQLEKEVLNLLAIGRNQESPYDIKNSPVATFIIKSIGFAETENLLKKAQEFFARSYFVGRVSLLLFSRCNRHHLLRGDETL